MFRPRRSARVALRRSAGPARRSNAWWSSGLRGQWRSHARQCQQRATTPAQMRSATTTVPAERQKRHRCGTEDNIIIFRNGSCSKAAARGELVREQPARSCGRTPATPRARLPQRRHFRCERIAVVSQRADQPRKTSRRSGNVRRMASFLTPAQTGTGASQA